MSDFVFSKNQDKVIDTLLQWFKSSKNDYITLGGYAGTGKTTILAHIGKLVHKEKKEIKIAFCSYTGRASRVLERRLNESGYDFSYDYIGTIHGLIYRPILDSRDNIVGWEKIPQEDFNCSLIIVDEASMISKDIWDDMLSFNVPILAVGDHGQLPPINGTFNLMDKPQLRLEEIFRQEKDNEIIKVSEIARKNGKIPFEEFSRNVKKIRKTDPTTQDILRDIFDSFDNSTMVLCGYNKSRIKLNRDIRSLHFDEEQPQNGDRVICLKNNRNMNIFNGITGTILDISKHSKQGFKYYDTEIALDYEDSHFWGKISIEQFNSPTLNDLKIEDLNYFDFGYALTVHKAQGGQAKRVVLFEERFPKIDDETYARWLYTAVTRAEEELFIIA